MSKVNETVRSAPPALAGVIAAAVLAMVALGASPAAADPRPHPHSHHAAPHGKRAAAQAADVTVYVNVAPPARRVVATRPRRPSARAVWIDGYWRWTGRRHVWVGGHWDAHPKGTWVKSHWVKRPRGWVLVTGHWQR